MVKLNLLLATATTLAIAAKTADASFGMCFGHRQKNFADVFGFYLWNDAGDNSNGYDTWSHFNTPANLNGPNGWRVHVKSKLTNGHKDVYVFNPKYSFEPRMNLEYLCGKTYENGYWGGVYFVCFASGNGWCERERDGMIAACRNHIEMGSDSVNCR
ncbi:hypothetical protein CPC16_000764 [Podila verticillata]|nr:hypothetical protein BGZ52_004179 [Haplosporangium bisporale]KAF9211782.1 hypothetical protein BGZ59_007604 [Podila verticillata]KAF9393918.1 hypothetical protein CPC16_000764 [Podila verticillata]KAI9238492.1 MAG: hypothetical protein BYD32DRAFT_450942 [Podila humilis]KFH64633.1 hypothetical protein MVEG_09365 [Podila verticillata NRRL 6337]